MKKKKEQGYAIIFILVLAAVLMITLSTATSTLFAFHKQNSQAKRTLSQQEKILNNKLTIK